MESPPCHVVESRSFGSSRRAGAPPSMGHRHSGPCRRQCLLIALLWTSVWRATTVFSHVEQALKPQLVTTGRRCWQVSNIGRCRRLDGTITHGYKHPSGYHVVVVRRSHVFVHRLVKFAFHGPPESRLAWEVNHLDGNKSNNCLDNLEYTTSKQNMLHFYKNLSRRSPGPKMSLPVRCRAVGSKRWRAYDSMTQAAEALGTCRPSITRCCREGTAVKGFECQLQKPTESVIEGKKWKKMIDPRTGRPVPGRMVSSRGRVKHKTGSTFTGCRRNDGYFTTTLGSGSERRTVLIHQLVARAFLWPPPTPSHTLVNHKDSNRSNNCVRNLEYVTPAQNVAHGNKMKASRLTSKAKPIQSRRKGTSGPWREHRSLSSAASQLGVHSPCISRCLLGKRKQTGGYEFRELAPLQDIPGEVWRDVNLTAFFEERAARKAWQSKRLRARSRVKALS